ncbi:MAG: ferrous iron transport protein B [Aquificota bacterium]|nr:MAG: ferrous iron transport protein B [Aquificota bacterium]
MKREYTIALAGNPNSGKTTVFNALTGARQKVGNWPGVTVERKEGKAKLKDMEVTVVDLPGIYSLTANSIDERIARDFLLKERPSLVAVVLDASNLERNLYLPLQLMELGVSRLVLICNMMDQARTEGLEIDTEGLSRALGVPIVPTVANKGVGIERLRNVLAVEVVREKGLSSCPLRYGESVEEAINELEEAIKKHKTLSQRYPLRWLALKLLEGDQEYLARLEEGNPTGGEIRAHLTMLRDKLEGEIRYDLETALVEKRYGYLKGLVRKFSKKKWDWEKRLSVSDKIDRMITNRFLGIPIFLVLMWITFKLTFSVGGPIADLIDGFFGYLGEHAAALIASAHGPAWLASLISDGIIGGVGSVLVFFPNIFILFLAIAVLEDSGYMARGAFVMDRFMHAIGLHGKSFIPMMLGFGCNIPGIMATRTMENEKDRLLTILVNPLMSCSARLPVYILFAGALFAHHQGTIIFSIYMLGVVLAIVLARVFKTLFFKGEPAPLVMELPPYRLPTWKGVFLLAWQRSAIFVKKAGTIIFAAVVLVWFLAHIPTGVEYASQQTLIGKLGTILAPIMKPAGFGFWQAAVALFFGVLAKEVVVGTLGTLYHTEEEKLGAVIAQHFTPLTGYAFMVMTLIYIPCIASIGIIKRETNSWKWTGFAVGYSLVLGWMLAVVIYQGGKLLGLG